jgi:hypothetical protein
VILDFDKELRIIALVRSLTDAVKRMAQPATKGLPRGKWLSDPAVTFLRAELYNRDGRQNWSYTEDREAARRLAIWCDRVAK